MFARVQAVFTSIYDARTNAAQAAALVPEGTPAGMLLSGARDALLLAEELLAAQDPIGALMRVQVACELLDEVVLLESDVPLSSTLLGEDGPLEDAHAHASVALEGVQEL